MEDNINAPQQKITTPDVSFQHHLKSYVTMIAFFWILWFFTGWRYSYNALPWPLWPMTGWGLGLVFHYIYSTQTKK